MQSATAARAATAAAVATSRRAAAEQVKNDNNDNGKNRPKERICIKNIRDKDGIVDGVDQRMCPSLPDAYSNMVNIAAQFLGQQ